MAERKFDDYSFVTTDQNDLINEIGMMESNSEWRNGVVAHEMELEAIESPLVAMDAAMRYGLDQELFIETAEHTRLLLNYDYEKFLVRDTARSTLCETAKLYGAALGRMSVPLLAETLNNGLTVARGTSLLLVRYGKCSAVHSDADGGYQIMPISKLVDISVENLQAYFGEAEFKRGFNSHGFTSALWELPDVQNDILTIYQDALRNAVSRNFAVTMMPAVRFTTSDTATSCACLTPVFVKSSGEEFQLVDGIQIRHSKRFRYNGVSGLDAFMCGAGEMYSQFTSCAEVIRKLAQTEVRNGCNCVVSLCKRYAIPKKYGECARLMVERFTQGGRVISAHDVYLCMTEALAEAKRCGMGWFQLNNMQEQIAKIPKADWAAHDVGGTVAWGS